MSGNKNAPGTSELLNKRMNEVAHEIGEMNPDDPVRAERLKELCALSQLSRSLKSEQNRIIQKRMDALARQIATLRSGDPRRPRIVSEILRLSEIISK